ncbi:MAG: GTPase HflX [Lachnospiraceae bacterium]|nr:GTPase HflX [Lachnospiraceae bacterium]
MEKIETYEREERAILVGVNTGAEPDFDACMEELEKLAEASQMEVVGVLTQNMPEKHRSLYVGTGKAEEIREAAKALNADIIVFYDSLSPTQLRNLQKEIECPVMDRTALILDIFEKRAESSEAKLQVEAAKLQYLLPRLVGMHEALTRQAGTSGSKSSRGLGEKKLELDKRKINHRLDELRRELKEVAAGRLVKRKKRMESRLPLVSLVGYTNAGKSTLLNAMVDTYMEDDEKKVLEKDMLFATLDTTVRRIDNGSSPVFLLSDTVGFIHNLPHSLIKAFHSTLEEVKEADLLLHVIDFADDQHQAHIKDTLATLTELGAAHIPMIYVYNKADKCMEDIPFKMDENRIYISASKQIGIEELTEMIIDIVFADYQEMDVLIPYQDGAVTSYFIENAEIKKLQYFEEGAAMTVRCHVADRDKYKKYMRDEAGDSDLQPLSLLPPRRNP